MFALCRLYEGREAVCFSQNSRAVEAQGQHHRESSSFANWLAEALIPHVPSVPGQVKMTEEAHRVRLATSIMITGC